MNQIILILSLFFCAQVGLASGQQPAGYFDITEIRQEVLARGAWEPVEVLSNTLLDQHLHSYAARNGLATPTEELSPEEIINIGEKLWQIIKDNEPVLDYKTKDANAIPRAAAEPYSLENWSLPYSNTYKLVFTNAYGFDVVTFMYKVIYTAHGTYEDKGEYLANVSVHPYLIDVAWGYTFNAEVEIADILNLGSKKDPLAGMQVNVNWNVSTIVKKIKGGEYYFVEGNGRFTAL